MNTLTVQLNDAQYRSLMELLDYAQNDLQSDLRSASDEESEAEAQGMLAEHEELVQALTATKAYLWSSGDGRLELEIPAEAVAEIARSGDNLPAVERWMTERSYLSKQVGDLDVFAMAEFLRDAGVEIDAFTVYQVRQHVLWMACHDINDEAGMED